MIYKVYPADSFMEEAIKFSKYLATQPTKGLGLIKQAINESLNNNLENQLEIEAKLQKIAGATEDSKEGIKAFLEKRTPNFKGK